MTVSKFVDPASFQTKPNVLSYLPGTHKCYSSPFGFENPFSHLQVFVVGVETQDYWWMIRVGTP